MMDEAVTDGDKSATGSSSRNLHVNVGAMVPSRGGGYLTVSWPLAELSICPSHLSIRFRGRLVNRLAKAVSLWESAPSANKGGSEEWVVNASDITGAIVGRRSAILKTASAQFRIAVLSHKTLLEITSELDRMNIPLDQVRSTIPKVFSMYVNRKM